MKHRNTNSKYPDKMPIHNNIQWCVMSTYKLPVYISLHPTSTANGRKWQKWPFLGPQMVKMIPGIQTTIA
jgi:hypothetical protein